MTRPNQFLSPEGDLEDYFVDESWLIDQWVGDTLLIWGRNTNGQLGNNTIVDRSTPATTLVGGANWKQVAGGANYTAAIKTDGTLWTWGLNSYGQLGTNNTTSRSTPVTTLAGGNNWKQVVCGNFHTTAIKTDGTLWTFGRNNFGQLGVNNTTDRLTPVTTFAGGVNWKQVSSGANNTASIKTDGTLWAWGQGGYGQLGDNTATSRSTPVTTFAGGTNWKQVGNGTNHTSAVKTDGTLWTFGRNTNGQLGVNDTIQRCTPVQTSAGGTNWKQVTGGANHTAAIKTDGTLWTWGLNTNGQLGVNDTNTRTTPVQTFTQSSNWKQVTGATNHTAAIKTDGTLWNWGLNTNGQLGVNDITQRNTPVTTLAGGTNWKQVASGGGASHTIAVTSGTDSTLFIS
jgi:alpha-tubulin suppressor-like RCC1 family protein